MILGTIPAGTMIMPALAALDFTTLSQAVVSDAVMLVEITATDGVLTTAGDVAVLGTMPAGTMSGATTGGTVQIDLSDSDWTSSPADTRQNIHFEGRAGDITLERAIPATPDAARRVAAAVSEIAIANADGEFDAIEDRLAIDGLPVTVSLLSHRSDAYADRRTVFSGIGRAWRAGARSLSAIAVSQGYLLDVPMLGLYGGTGGADGDAALKGAVIQEIWGLVRNVSPQLVEEGPRIYRVHARQIQALNGVYVRGAPITGATLHASYAALAAASPAGGTYDLCNGSDGCFFKLGSTADGAVTFDAVGDVSATTTHAGIMRQIITRFGQPVMAGAFDTAAAFVPGACGIVFADQVTGAEAINRLAASASFWWGDDGAGVISIGRLAAPQDTGGVILDEDVIVGDVERMDAPAVAWRVVASYRRNWTPLSSADVVPPPTITESRRAELIATSRTAAVSAEDRRARNAQAVEITHDTLFDGEADALAIGGNLLSLYAPGRGMWRVPLGLAGQALALGQQARLSWPRVGLSDGRNVRVVGHSLRNRRVDVTVLG